MARTPITDSANIFLQGSQLYQNANSKIFDAISGAADLYARQKAQQEANLSAERMKQAELQAKMAQATQERQDMLLDPQKLSMSVAQKYAQNPDSVTPQEMEMYNYAQQTMGAKTGLDQYGRPVSTYSPVPLGNVSPAAAMMAPSPTQQNVPSVSPVAGAMLAPPRFDGSPSSTEQFNADFNAPPAPIGTTEKVKKPDYATMTPVDMEEFKSNLDTNKALTIEEGKNKIEQDKIKREAKFKTNKQFSSLLSDFQNISNKVDKAVSQSNFLNTGIMAGKEGTGEGRKTTGEGVLKSGYVTGGTDLQNTLKTLEADSAFSALQNMRDNSPTGGALGGIAVRELELLGAAKQSLEQSQSSSQLDENLKAYKETRKNAVRNVAEAYKEQFGEYPKGYEPKKFEAVSDIDARLKAAGYSGAQIEAYKREKKIK